MAGELDDVADAVTMPRAKQRSREPTHWPPPDRYRVLEQIGEGGMGRVYRAHDTTLGRDVALKLIEGGGLQGPEQTAQRDAFVREARAAARVLHPNIAIVHDVDPDAGWLVMELVEGESLRARADRGPLSVALVGSIARQMFAALEAAHGKGVIHRDIKPTNVMLTPGDHVKLVDFGVACIVDVDTPQIVEQGGTPAYMAPEQASGGVVDERTDLYGVGATLRELLRPTLARARIEDPALVAVTERCLQHAPDARFASARDALAALTPPARSWPRTVGPWVVGAAAAITIGALAGGLVGKNDATPRPTSPRPDPIVDQAFVLAQRGENERALQLLADYLVKHPTDPNAHVIAFLAKWWQGSTLDEAKKKIVELPLRPAQRALVNGIELITQRRDPEAIAYLEQANRQTPNAVEILYVLGEAQWHGGHLDKGIATLERAFAIEPRWEMTLHHVLEYRLSRGETAQLQPVLDRLKTTDAPAAAALDCKIAISERDYPRAVRSAQASLASDTLEKIAELYLCLAQAQVLTGDIDAGAATAKHAFDLWPLEAKDKGGFAQYAEFLLYRRDLEGYLELTRGRQSSQRALAILVQRPRDTALPVNEPQPEWPRSRMSPLGAATWMLQQHVYGRDASSVYTTYPEPEVRAWGAALAAEAAGDRTTAIAKLRESLTFPAKGDTRMLVAHRLAKLLHETGDVAGAVRACEDVLRPRFYVNYRAILLPDCERLTR